MSASPGRYVRKWTMCSTAGLAALISWLGGTTKKPLLAALTKQFVYCILYIELLASGKNIHYVSKSLPQMDFSVL